MFELETAHQILILYLPLVILAIGWILPWEILVFLVGMNVTLLDRNFLRWRTLVFLVLVYAASVALAPRLAPLMTEASPWVGGFTMSADYVQTVVLIGLCFFFCLGFCFYPLCAAMSAEEAPEPAIRRAVSRHFMFTWILAGAVIYFVVGLKKRLGIFDVEIVETYAKELSTPTVLVVLLLTGLFTLRMLRVCLAMSPNKIRGFMLGAS